MKIAIIGAGAMGGAVGRGLLAAGVSPESLRVSNPTDAKLRPFADAGCATTSDNRAAVSGADVVIVAVKPWILPDVLRQIAAVTDSAHTLLAVIAASVTCAEIDSWIDGKYAAGALVMPNTAMNVRRSMTFAVPLPKSGEVPSQITEIFEKLGTVKAIEEAHLPAAMALASCGIAYALRYIRAAVEGGVQMGIRAAEAQDIVAATVEGAAALLTEQPGAHAEAEIDKVTTPGGVTIRGLNTMEAAGFTHAVISGLLASTSK